MMGSSSRKVTSRDNRLFWLLFASAILLFTFLSGRGLWTQEHRWADIVTGMFYRHDFLHPYLGQNNYYDKPLLSYWLIAAITAVTGKLSLWTLRLPSALAGILSIVSIYKIGETLKNKTFGLLSGWMLLTTFYFIFWAKTSSADMLNLAGTLFALAWYFCKRDQLSFFNYAVFFLIIAVTGLLKGLVGPVVTVLAIVPDLILRNEWKKHLNVRFFLSMIPAAIVYILPFWASAHFGGESYGQSGLYLVYRENIVRYFAPFDHKDPIYTYFIYLPLYLLPWTFFFIPALISLKSRWKALPLDSKWYVLATFILFLFFTLSGSRRSYYVLPIVPFAILMTADWLLSKPAFGEILKKAVLVFFGVFFLYFDVLQPLYYVGGGATPDYVSALQTEANKIKPWKEWKIVALDAESKNFFYLGLPPDIPNKDVQGKREGQTKEKLLAAWPELLNAHPKTIILTRKQYVPMLKEVLHRYKLVEVQDTWGERLLRQNNPNALAAFIPIS